MVKIPGRNGYDISCNFSIPEGADKIVIAMHGFCGDMESSCIAMLQDKINKLGIGLVRFDWPGHGISEVDADHLSIANCLSDLDTVYKKVSNDYPHARLFAFATSFGGYLALLYYYNNRNAFHHVILRSPAIKMYDVSMNTLLDDHSKQELKTKGFFQCGFERQMNVPLDFINKLKEFDVFSMYENQELPTVTILHGNQDDVVPLQDSIDFARAHHCGIHVIDGADHRYKNPGELEEVVEFSARILL